MKRWAFNILLRLSLLLTLGVVALWLCSYRRYIGISTSKPLRKTDVWLVSCAAICVGQGEITLSRQRWWDLSGSASWTQGQRRGEFFRGSDDVNDQLLPPSCTYDTSPLWRRMGFFHIEGGSFVDPSEWGLFMVGVPIWSALLVCSAPLILLLPRRVKRISRVRNGHCLVCGYDLRASKDICPECGTPIPTNLVRNPLP